MSNIVEIQPVKKAAARPLKKSHVLSIGVTLDGRSSVFIVNKDPELWGRFYERMRRQAEKRLRALNKQKQKQKESESHEIH